MDEVPFKKSSAPVAIVRASWGGMRASRGEEARVRTAGAARRSAERKAHMSCSEATWLPEL